MQTGKLRNELFDCRGFGVLRGSADNDDFEISSLQNSNFPKL